MPDDVIQLAIRAVDEASGTFGRVGTELDTLDSKAKKAALGFDNLDKAAARMKDVGTKLSLGVTLPIAGIATAATKAASDLSETTNKIDVLFGQSSKAITDWSKTAANSIGQSRQQALDAAATFAVFGKSAGLAGDELVKFSKQNVQLASDMASFFNTSPEEAITAIGAAFRGESEPIRRYGVLLDDASLKQQALSMGIIKTTTEALQPQQRVLAAQALILKQTSAAQGDFARTADGLANSTRIVKAQLQDTLATLGEKLLPVALQGVTVVKDLLGAFEGLPKPMQDVIIAFGGLAAAAGPVLVIGGKLIDVYGKLSPAAIGLIDSFGGTARAVKDVGEYLKVAGVSGATLRDAFVYLKSSGALLTGEIGLIVAGLIAITKYLEEVGNAAKSTNEDLIAMSRSGDVFKQAGASTEILTNGQNRLKIVLDATHEKIKQGTKEYNEYQSAIDGTAKAAGYEINAQGDLVQVYYSVGGRIEKLIEAHYRLSRAQYDAIPGTGKLGEAWNLLVDTGKQFADIIAPKSNAALIASTRNFGALTGAISRAQAAGAGINVVFKDGAAIMDDLKVAMAGAISKEMTQFGDKQSDLAKRAQDLKNEIADLRREQGSAAKTTVEHAMSSNELAVAQANLADMQRRLSKETDPIKQQQLSAQIAVARDRINEANTAVVSYVDNSKRIKELEGQYDEVNKEIEANAKAHEDATRRILFGYAEQQLAVGGLTENEAKALDALAVKWGLKSQADIDAMQAIRDASIGLAKDNSIDAYLEKLGRAENKAIGIKITPEIDYKNLREGKQERQISIGVVPKIEKSPRVVKDLEGDLKYAKPALVVTPQIDAKKAKSDMSAFWAIPEIKKTQEPVNMVVKADTTNASIAMRYFNDYSLSPAITYYDALLQRAQQFSDIVKQTPSLPTLPGVPPAPTPTPPTEPVRPPTSGPPEFARGGNFVVPSGYPNDSYRIGVSSGERVTVTPRGGRSSGISIGNVNINVSDTNATPEQIKRAVYDGIVEVFNGAQQ